MTKFRNPNVESGGQLMYPFNLVTFQGKMFPALRDDDLKPQHVIPLVPVSWNRFCQDDDYVSISTNVITRDVIQIHEVLFRNFQYHNRLVSVPHMTVLFH